MKKKKWFDMKRTIVHKGKRHVYKSPVVKGKWFPVRSEGYVKEEKHS